MQIPVFCYQLSLFYENKGKIYISQTSKTILSVATGFDVFRFVELDTQLVEVEDGMTENESVTRSVRSTIEAAVYELILQGDERGYWTIQWPVTENKIKEEVAEVFEEVEILVVTEEKENNNNNEENENEENIE